MAHDIHALREDLTGVALSGNQTRKLEYLVVSLKTQKKAVYELHPGGSDCIGALGYVRVFDEIIDFSHRSGVHFSHIIH